jgi:hypothetical protein
MNTKTAILRANLNLRGHRFREGSMLKVWDTGNTIQIQPASCKDKYQEAMWYSLPHIHLRDLFFLDKPLEELYSIGLF